MPTPEQTARRAVRIVEVAKAMLADPNNMEKRRTYMQATFNIDWTAAAIVSLASSRCGLCHGVGKVVVAPGTTDPGGERDCPTCSGHGIGPGYPAQAVLGSHERLASAKLTAQSQTSPTVGNTNSSPLSSLRRDEAP